MTRYQVFISSTYKDLIKERWIVKKALLENQCFPVGMEEFPAIDLQQFEYIKRLIAESDYFIIILGGRVGSICKETGESYTYMEYQYAVEQNIPIVAIIKQDKKGIFDCCENDEERTKYYNRFVEKVLQDRLCKLYRKKKNYRA